MTILQRNRFPLRKALLLALVVTLTALAGATVPPAAASSCDDCETAYTQCTANCIGLGRFICLRECNFNHEECTQTC